MITLRRRAYAIKKEVLDLILTVSKESYPNEFAGVLRCEEGVITEIMLLPGTVSGGRSALLRLHMLPIDYTVVGTVHSHPGRSNHPSQGDLQLFSRFGYVHIITRVPYDKNSWKAWDLQGKPYTLEVVDEETASS
ncbi:MAG: Mov34/MPN/PAD-1 family protein [Thermoplasmata archaeon]